MTNNSISPLFKEEDVFARIWVLGCYDLKITKELWNNKKLRMNLIKCIDNASKQKDEQDG